MPAEKPTILISVNNHFDPTWRRCFDRRFTFKGEEYASYADIEGYYIEDNLSLAGEYREYVFEVESALVLRKFIERHPDRLPELRALASDGRFKVSGAGDNIIDTNMVLGESIVRNYLLGLCWVESTLGTETRLAVRYDGFGNSAQLPQILRGCGIRWVTGLGYSPLLGKYWRGLDGSVVCGAFLPRIGSGNCVHKYRPCPKCHGEGCAECGGRGIDISFRSPLPDKLNLDALSEYGAGLVTVTSEEALPSPEMPDWARSICGDYYVRFATQDEAYPWVEKWISRVDDPPAEEIHPSPELNPNNTGVYVSRIKTKQTCRRQEYALLGAEALSSLAALGGQPVPKTELRQVWRKLLFAMFHDAITATHVDPAYEELQDVWAEIDLETASIQDSALRSLVSENSCVVSVLNPFGSESTQLASVVLASPASLVDESGNAVLIVRCEPAEDGKVMVEFIARGVPAFGSVSYRIGEGEPPVLTSDDRPVIENDRFRVTADEHGITEIFDKKLGVISEREEYRPGEFVIERDEGSPWATLHPDRTRKGLSEYTRLVSVERGPAHQSMVFECSISRPAQEVGQIVMDARTTVTLYSGIDRVDFASEVDWDAINVRIRVAMPVHCPGKSVYGIPYGMLERRPYEPNFYAWTAANGDWPAINWAGVEGSDVSLAWLSKGLVSYTTESTANGAQTMFLSILRSPHMPTYLHEPKSYSMTDYDGMRDAGLHKFEWALTAYDAPFAASSVVADAESYNAGLIAVAGKANLPAAPELASDCARVSSIKWAEDGNALILRLYEYRGSGGSAHVTVPHGVKSVSRVNMLEREGETLEVRSGKVEIRLRAWEIATLRLEL